MAEFRNSPVRPAQRAERRAHLVPSAGLISAHIKLGSDASPRLVCTTGLTRRAATLCSRVSRSRLSAADDQHLTHVIDSPRGFSVAVIRWHFERAEPNHSMRSMYVGKGLPEGRIGGMGPGESAPFSTYYNKAWVDKVEIDISQTCRKLIGYSYAHKGFFEKKN